MNTEAHPLPVKGNNAFYRAAKPNLSAAAGNNNKVDAAQEEEEEEEDEDVK